MHLHYQYLQQPVSHIYGVSSEILSENLFLHFRGVLVAADTWESDSRFSLISFLPASFAFSGLFFTYDDVMIMNLLTRIPRMTPARGISPGERRKLSSPTCQPLRHLRSCTLLRLLNLDSLGEIIPHDFNHHAMNTQHCPLATCWTEKTFLSIIWGLLIEIAKVIN